MKFKVLRNSLLATAALLSLSSEVTFAGQDPFHFEELPTDLQKVIYKQMGIREAARFSQVSKAKKEMGDSMSDWKTTKNNQIKHVDDIPWSLRLEAKLVFLDYLIANEAFRINSEKPQVETAFPEFSHVVQTAKLKETSELKETALSHLGHAVALRDPVAIKEKATLLFTGFHAQSPSPEATKNFIESLYWKANPTAIALKRDGLIEGKYGYDRDIKEGHGFNEYLIEKGNIEALEHKYSGLLHGSNGYEKDEKAATVVNGLLVERGSFTAIEYKVLGHLVGKYGYSKDPDAAKLFIASLHDIEPLDSTFTALFNGWGGCEKDEKAAVRLNDMMAKEGYIRSIQRKAHGLVKGKYGYKKNEKSARPFIDSFIRKLINLNHEYSFYNEYFDPIEWKINGLCKGKYGYKKNMSAAKNFIEFLIKKGNDDAIALKLDGLLKGKYGYEKDEQAVKTFVESLVEKGHDAGIYCKVKGLTKGECGYKIDTNAARDFIEKWFEKTNEDFNFFKFNGLLKGKYGYQKDVNAAVALMDNWAGKGNEVAIGYKFKGLLNGEYGYPEDREAAKAFLKSLSEKNVAAIEDLYPALSHGNVDEELEKDEELAVFTNDVLVQLGNLFATHRKFEGLWDGKNGYKQNKLEAYRFARKHKFIPQEYR